MGKFIDLTGQKFNKLTVIERAENIGKQTAWKCLCDCGNEVIVYGSHLKNGNTKSCGCLMEEFQNNKTIDISGQKFGRLTVIKEHHTQKGKATKWDCVCDCGNYVTVRGNSLKKGGTLSCGCYKKEKAREVHKKYNKYIKDENLGFYIGITNNEERFFIDEIDYDLIKDYRWCVSDGYATAHIPEAKKMVRMHRLIMKAKEGEFVDHIDNNRMNNRRNNLRFATIEENNRNAKKRKMNKTGFIGVTFHKKDKKYIAQITVSGERKHLGRFPNIEDAIKIRLESELKYYGKDFAPQRHLFGKYDIK